MLIFLSPVIRPLNYTIIFFLQRNMRYGLEDTANFPLFDDANFYEGESIVLAKLAAPHSWESKNASTLILLLC